MSWQPEIDDLNRRREAALRMGNAERIKRQKDNGRLTVRERLDGLLDDDSFREIGSVSGSAEYDADGVLTSFQAASFIFGRARLDGREITVGGHDFTISASNAGDVGLRKHFMQERMAADLRLPVVRMIDGAGGSVSTIEKIGRTYIPDIPGWQHILENLSQVPVVALGLGVIAGYPAALLVASHYSVMVRENSHMFMGGPPVVARLGEIVTKEELGGADLQARAGAIDDVVDSEEEAFENARRFLSYLPSSIHEVADRTTPNDDIERRDPWLIEAIPRDRRKIYDVRRILRSLFDQDSIFEMGRAYGGAVVTAFARLDGWPVAVMASDPRIYGGGWSAAASQKVTRFVDLATTFHLPVVNLVDIPGFVIGRDAEMAGTIRHGCRAMSAVYQTDVPWCTILMRKSFGVAGSAHTNHTRVQYRYAWPSGDWGSMPLEGGIEAAYRAEIAAADDPAVKLAEIEERLNRLRSPFRTAEAFMVEDIIDPRETRPILCAFANTVAKLRTPGRSSFGMRP